MSTSNIQIGHLLSESSHYIVKRVDGDALICKHIESGDEVAIGKKYAHNYTNSADVHTEVVKVGKEDKKDGTPGIRTIFEHIHSAQVFTVCFTKQDKAKTIKAIKAEKEAQREQAVALIEKAKKNKKSIAEAYKIALEFIQENPISPNIKGEERILRGYKIQFESRDGRYNCIDVDINDENNIRPVNINTIKWLIYNGVKYVVE